MIGFTNKLTGRMGNRLFQYHFMRQLSKKYELETFHLNIPDNIWFESMEEKKLDWNPFRKKVKFKSNEIIALGKDSFLNKIQQAKIEKKVIVLEPPLLGDFFYDYLFFDPNECIQIKEIYKNSNLTKSDNSINIAIHFRGTDFETWNKDAILDLDYYINAIDFSIKFYKDSKLDFYLFTDDLSLDTYTKIINYLEYKNIDFYLGDMSKEPIYDFYTMSECDVIISSPSTFSIWAGVLGKRKKIIHSDNWIKNRIDVNDRFWIDLDKSDNDIYKLWRKL